MKALLKIVLLITGAALVIASCKKEEGNTVPSRRDMLLGTWRRVQRATDYNHNGRIDSSEILNAPATDTLIFEISPDATAKRTLYYKGEHFPTPGTWHLQANDEELVFQPSTSTTRTDTFHLETVSDTYFRCYYPEDNVNKWESYTRP